MTDHYTEATRHGKRDPSITVIESHHMPTKNGLWNADYVESWSSWS